MPSAVGWTNPAPAANRSREPTSSSESQSTSSAWNRAPGVWSAKDLASTRTAGSWRSVATVHAVTGTASVLAVGSGATSLSGASVTLET